jgi:hypothetical protein
MLLARRLLTAGFVKKPRQHYGVVYVFCLTSSQNSPGQEIRFILFASLRDVNKIKPDFMTWRFCPCCRQKSFA